MEFNSEHKPYNEGDTIFYIRDKQVHKGTIHFNKKGKARVKNESRREIVVSPSKI